MSDNDELQMDQYITECNLPDYIFFYVGILCQK